MIKRRLLRITPFLLIAVFAAIFFVAELLTASGEKEGWTFLAAMAILPFVAAMIGIDVLLKFAFTQKIKWIFIIEMFLLLALVYYWIII